MNLSDGSAAFGSWAAQKIRTRRGAEYSTVALGHDLQSFELPPYFVERNPRSYEGIII